MRVSTKSIYALHLLAALAQHARYSPTPLHLREVAQRRGLPFKFLEQIALRLKAAGWIRGLRGKDGGYLLEVDPRSISLHDILHQLDGPRSPSASSTLPPLEGALEGVLGRCAAAQTEILSSITLAVFLASLETRDIEYVI